MSVNFPKIRCKETKQLSSTADKVLYYKYAFTSWQIDEETVETMANFIFLGSKITADGDCSHEIKRRLLLGRKVMTNLDSIVNHELPDVQAGFRKGRGTRDQIANILWIIEKAREFQKKTCTFALLTMPKPLIVCITTNCGVFLKKWKYQTTLSAS